MTGVPVLEAKGASGAILDEGMGITLAIVQNNSFQALSSPVNPESQVVRKMKVVATAYSSTVWETDEDPYTTASGSKVRDGIIANNLLPFGTKVKMPEIYGDKVFVVTDRMNSRKGDNQIDIWFSSHEEAKKFGAKNTIIEVLEN